MTDRNGNELYVCRECGQSDASQFYPRYLTICKACYCAKNSERRHLRTERKHYTPRWKWEPEQPSAPVPIEHFPKTPSLGTTVSTLVFRGRTRQFKKAWQIA